LNSTNGIIDVNSSIVQGSEYVVKAEIINGYITRSAPIFVISQSQNPGNVTFNGVNSSGSHVFHFQSEANNCFSYDISVSPSSTVLDIEVLGDPTNTFYTYSINHSLGTSSIEFCLIDTCSSYPDISVVVRTYDCPIESVFSSTISIINDLQYFPNENLIDLAVACPGASVTCGLDPNLFPVGNYSFQWNVGFEVPGWNLMGMISNPSISNPIYTMDSIACENQISGIGYYILTVTDLGTGCVKEYEVPAGFNCGNPVLEILLSESLCSTEMDLTLVGVSPSSLPTINWYLDGILFASGTNHVVADITTGGYSYL